MLISDGKVELYGPRVKVKHKVTEASVPIIQP
jgi:hypothetical protein